MIQSHNFFSRFKICLHSVYWWILGGLQLFCSTSWIWAPQYTTVPLYCDNRIPWLWAQEHVETSKPGVFRRGTSILTKGQEFIHKWRGTKVCPKVEASSSSCPSQFHVSSFRAAVFKLELKWMHWVNSVIRSRKNTKLWKQVRNMFCECTREMCLALKTAWEVNWHFLEEKKIFSCLDN